jgi:O-antigen/teichoic acid export membrane protein
MRKYLVTFFDQGVTAIAGIALQIFLIRSASLSDYGSFAFWQGIGLLLLGVQGALITTQLSVRGTSEREQFEPMFGALNIALVAATLAAAIIFASPVGHLADLSPVPPIAVAAYLAGMLLYQYARGVAFSRLVPATVLKIDLLYICTGTLLVGVTYLATGAVELSLVLGSLACAGVAAGIAGLALQPGALAMSFRGEALAKYRDIYHDGKWALIGVITYEVQTRSYIYVVTALAGPTVLAELIAAQLPFRPISLLYSSWSMLARPQFAAAYTQGDRNVFARKVLTSALGLSIISALYLAFLALSWPLITGWVFADRYPNIGLIALGWGISSAIVSIRAVFNIALQAGRKFRLLTMANVAGAIGSLAGTAIVAIAAAYRLIPFGVVVGDLMMMALIWRGYRQMRRSAEAEPAGSH